MSDHRLCMLGIFVSIVLASVVVPLAVSDAEICSNCIAVSLCGNSISFNRDRVISPNVTGQLEILSTGDGHVDLTATFFDDDSIACTESSDIPVIWEITVLPRNDRVVTMDIDDYQKGTFVDIRLFANGSASVYVATDINDIQYSGVGYAEGMLTLEPYKIRSSKISDSSLIEDILREQLPSTEVKIDTGGKKCINPPRLALLGPPPGPRVYCVVHQLVNFAVNPVTEDIGQWCIDYSWVTHSIFRLSTEGSPVTEAQIKSDLRYYNKKDLLIEDLSRYIGAYHISAHGIEDEDEPDKAWLVQYTSDYIYPSEITALWWTSDRYAYLPTESILELHVCSGLFDDDESDGGETCDAFMNYGAKAFVSAKGGVSIYMHPWLSEFWWSLTYEDETINKAISDANEEWPSGLPMTCFPSTCGTKTLPNS